MKINNNMSQDDRCEMFGCLIDVVEDWLESKGITPADIPNEDRDKDAEFEGSEGLAIIYGEDYDVLANGFAAVLGINRDEIILNDEERKIADIIEEAKNYVKGKVEVDLFDGLWYVMDYREWEGQAVEIDAKDFDLPLIGESLAANLNIDVRKCCDYCHVYCCG